MVPSSEGVVHSPKLQLLAGSPEVRDQELTGEEIPVDAGGGVVSRVRHTKRQKMINEQGQQHK